MPINWDDYEIIEDEDQFAQSEYPQRNFEQSPYTPPVDDSQSSYPRSQWATIPSDLASGDIVKATNAALKVQQQVMGMLGTGMTAAAQMPEEPLPDSFRMSPQFGQTGYERESLSSIPTAPPQRKLNEIEMAAAQKWLALRQETEQKWSQFPGSVPGQTDEFINSQIPGYDEIRQQEVNKSAGVEEIPFKLKASTALSSGFTKAGMLPQKVGETLNDITGFSRVMDAVGMPGPEGGWQSNTERALQQITAKERQMSTADEMITGGGAGYQILEGTARGLAELPAQLLPGMAAKTTEQALKIASGTAGALGGVQQFTRSRGEGQGTLEALPRAVLSGMITKGVTQAFGLTGAESILRSSGASGIKAKVREVLSHAKMEGLEESVDEIGQDILERHAENPDKPLADTIKDVLISFAVGFNVGGIATGGRAMLPSSRQGPARKSEVDQPQDLSGIRLNQGTQSPSKAAEEFHQLQAMEKSGKLDVESARRLEDLKTVSESGMTVEDLDYLEQERQGMRLESTVTTGSNPDDPYTGKVMTANFNTGKVDINPYELAAQMKGMNPEERKAYIKSALSEEQIHLSTPQETADKFVKNATGVEKFLAGWRYTGDVRGRKPDGKKVSQRNLGHEMLRSQIQRMRGITRTELTASVKSGQLTTKILLATEDAIFSIRHKLGTDASKEQIAALDQVEKNVKEGLRIASGAEGDDEGVDTLRIPGNATPEVNTFIQEFMKPDGKIASRSDDPSVATAIKTGLALKSTADLDALLSLNNKVRGRLQELRDKRKSKQPLTAEETKEMFHLMGRVQFPREAVEAATNTGGWIEGTPNNNYGPRPLDWQGDPGVRKWIEQHGSKMDISLPEEAPAAIRRGGPSKRGQEIAEQRRRILEAQAKAKGEELPPELQTKAEPQGAPVPAEDRAAPETWGFITPTPAQISENANEVLSGEVKLLPAAERKKSTEGMTPEEKAELKQPSAKYERPSFQKFVESFTGKGQRAIAPSKLREAWEDSVWANILNAPSQRLESLRKALGLEKNYGSSTIAEPTPATPEPRAKYRAEQSAEEAGDAVKDWRRSAATRMTDAAKRESSRRRYRLTLTRAIAMKLIDEANEGRPSLDRSEVGVDDIDFDNAETAHSAYQAISRQDLADPKRLKAILRDGARGSMSDPESASHRLVAVASASGEVFLLSTYNDAGVQRVVSPTGTGMRHRPHEVLDAAFLKRYRPFASVLLNDPIKAFKQKYKTMSEFNDQIGREAAERARIGDWEIVPEGPAADEFTVEGTPGLEGEGGSFMGPERDIVAPSAGGRSLQSEGKVTSNELSSMLDHIMDEVNEFQSPGDVEHSLEALVFEQDRKGKISNHSRLVVNSYRKVFDAIEAANPNLSREETLDRMAAAIYETYQSSETAAEFVKKSMAQFAPQSARPAGPEAQAGGAIGRMPGGRSAAELVPKGSLETQPAQPGETAEERAAREKFVAERSAALVGDRPLPEMSPREAAQRANVEASVAGGPQLSEAARRQGIQTARQRALRKQGVLPTYEQAQQIYDENFPEEGEGPATLRRRVGPTITAPEEVMPDTASPIPRFISNVNTALTKAMGIERIPLVGRLWGARAKIKDDVDREIVGYSVKRNIGNSQAALIGARMAALDKELGTPFKQDKDGKILNLNAAPNQSRFPSDVFEAWQQQEIVPEKMTASRKFSEDDIAEYSEKHPRTITLTKEQDRLFREMLKVVEDGYKYLDEKNAKLETYNGESRESRERQALMVGLPKGVEWHAFPRVALFKRSVGPIKTEIRRRIGESYGIEKERLYKTEAQGQVTTAYEPDMTKRMVAFTQRIYKAVADADLANSEILKGETPEKRVGKLAKEYEAELRSGEMTQQDIVDLSKQARLGVEGEISSHPAFSGKVYPIEIANKLNKAFGEQSHKWVRVASELSTMTKAFMLTGDLAQYLQQGGPMMLRHPGMWANATVKSLRSIADPVVTGKFLRNPENYKAATEFVQAGGSLGHLQDFMSGSQPGELATRVPAFRQVVIRSGRAFGTFFDIAKIEMWKGLRETTPKSEWPKVIETIENIVLSGRMEAAGMNHARATGERIMFMAAAYYRGAVGLVAGMAEKGVAGSEARKALGSYAAGLTLMMVASYLAAGMSWEEIRKRLMPGLNNPKFLSYPVKVGGETVEVGPGGIVLNLASLGVDVAMTIKDDPKALASFGMKNPLIRWLTTKLGPIPGLGRKIATGEDVFGNPVKPVTAVAELFAPFPVQKAIRLAGSSNKGAAAVSGAASFIGLTGSKYRATSEIYDLANKFMDSEGLRKSPEWKQVQTDAASYSKLRSAAGSGSQRRFNDVYRQLLETHAEADIKKAMKQWAGRPFTGSKENESLFKESLNDHEFDIYEQAREEREEAYERFVEMLYEREE